MPYSITADDERLLIKTSYYGDVDLSDMRSAIQAAMSRMENADAAYCILTDFSDVDLWRATTRELLDLGRGMVPKGPSMRIERSALVAPTDHIFGDLRAWIAATDELPFERVVFRDVARALAWVQGEGPDDYPSSSWP